MLTSWKDTVPWVGSSNRLMRRRRVDFPAPERPMTPSICPDAISRLMSLTATVVPKRLVSPCSLSIASPYVPHRIGALCQLCACCQEPQCGRHQGLSTSRDRRVASWVTRVALRSIIPHDGPPHHAPHCDYPGREGNGR